MASNSSNKWDIKCQDWSNKYNNKYNTRIIVIGDVHFMLRNRIDTSLAHKRILNIIQLTRPDFVVVLGDVMHEHNKMEIVNHVHAMDFLHDICILCPLYIIVGNHDRVNNSVYCDRYHPFTACHWWPNTRVADKPISDIINNNLYVFVPYVHPGRFIEALNEFTPEWSNVGSNVELNVGSNVGSSSVLNVGSSSELNVGSNVGSNVELNVGSNVGSSSGLNVGSSSELNVGSNVGSNVELNVGSNVVSSSELNVETSVESNVVSTSSSTSSSSSTFFPAPKTVMIFAHQEFYKVKMGAIVSEVGDKWASDLPLVVTGHVHQYQRLQDNILYVGTPIQHGFGDTPDKSISLIEVGQDKSWTEERLFLDLPAKITLRLHCSDITDDYMPPEGEVRLVIHGDAVEWEILAKKQVIRRLEAMGVKIKPVTHRPAPTNKIVFERQTQGFANQIMVKLDDNRLIEKMRSVCLDTGIMFEDYQPLNDNINLSSYGPTVIQHVNNHSQNVNNQNNNYSPSVNNHSPNVNLHVNNQNNNHSPNVNNQNNNYSPSVNQHLNNYSPSVNNQNNNYSSSVNNNYSSNINNNYSSNVNNQNNNYSPSVNQSIDNYTQTANQNNNQYNNYVANSNNNQYNNYVANSNNNQYNNYAANSNNLQQNVHIYNAHTLQK